MFESQDSDKGIACRRKIMKDMLQKSNVEVTELGERLLGLKEWN